MMRVSAEAAVLYAEAGVHAFIALVFALVWALRREAREHGVFALLALALALSSVGAALAADAASVAEVVAALRVQFVPLMLGVAFFVELSVHLSRGERPLFVRFAWLWCGTASALAAAGLFFDPATRAPAYDGASRLAGGAPTAALLWPGAAAIAGALVIGLAGIALLVQVARQSRAVAGALLATLTPIGTGTFDLITRMRGLPSLHLGAHGVIFAVVGLSWVLLARMARVDTELEARERELIDRYDELRRAQEQLVRKEQLAAVGELSAVIAHEVRNPLAIIRNAVSGLRKPTIAPSDVEVLLGILDEEADRLNRLVQDLLTYAKPVTPEPRSVDLLELVRHAARLAQDGQPHAHNIDFEFEPPAAPPERVQGDPALLRHALINIVDNAIQAMPRGGTISIGCRTAELEGRPAVAVYFHDEGEGMDTLVRSRARDPFFTTRATGTGLGLAIVERVARVHGGKVDIQSSHGHGTTVTFVIPRDRVSMPPPGTFS